MTVSELMTLLATLPADAEVVFPDTYEESEGWGEHDPVLPVHGAALVEGRVVLDADW